MSKVVGVVVGLNGVGAEHGEVDSVAPIAEIAVRLAEGANGGNVGGARGEAVDCDGGGGGGQDGGVVPRGGVDVGVGQFPGARVAGVPNKGHTAVGNVCDADVVGLVAQNGVERGDDNGEDGKALARLDSYPPH